MENADKLSKQQLKQWQDYTAQQLQTLLATDEDKIDVCMFGTRTSLTRLLRSARAVHTVHWGVKAYSAVSKHSSHLTCWCLRSGMKSLWKNEFENEKSEIFSGKENRWCLTFYNPGLAGSESALSILRSYAPTTQRLMFVACHQDLTVNMRVIQGSKTTARSWYSVFQLFWVDIDGVNGVF